MESLADITGTKNLIGGKARRLARMIRAGLPVKNGVVVTTSEVATILSDGAVPTHIQGSLASSLIFPVAVRSSGIGEDGKLTWAGQFKTKLQVASPGVNSAILECGAPRSGPMLTCTGFPFLGSPSSSRRWSTLQCRVCFSPDIRSMVDGSTSSKQLKDMARRSFRASANRDGSTLIHAPSLSSRPKALPSLNLRQPRFTHWSVSEGLLSAFSELIRISSGRLMNQAISSFFRAGTLQRLKR